jgi:hypothetical protein
MATVAWAAACRRHKIMAGIDFLPNAKGLAVSSKKPRFSCSQAIAVCCWDSIVVLCANNSKVFVSHTGYPRRTTTYVGTDGLDRHDLTSVGR